MSLEDVVSVILKEDLAIEDNHSLLNEKITFDMLHQEVLKNVISFVKSKAEDSSYEETNFLWLNNAISHQYNSKRIFYLTFDMTIPANSTLKLECEQIKEASNSYMFYERERGIDGYEMAVTLGSNLNFTEQAASISGYDSIEIANQNYGFDLEDGITEVSLDLDTPFYYVEVRALEEESSDTALLSEADANNSMEFHFNFAFLGIVPILLCAVGLIIILFLLVKLIEKKSLKH